jgi:hypothetical protein
MAKWRLSQAGRGIDRCSAQSDNIIAVYKNNTGHSNDSHSVKSDKSKSERQLFLIREVLIHLIESNART